MTLISFSLSEFGLKHSTIKGNYNNVEMWNKSVWIHTEIKKK